LITLETVPIDTPAVSAIWYIVIRGDVLALFLLLATSKLATSFEQRRQELPFSTGDGEDHITLLVLCWLRIHYAPKPDCSRAIQAGRHQQILSVF